MIAILIIPALFIGHWLIRTYWLPALREARDVVTEAERIKDET